MVKLKEIHRPSTFAWSPLPSLPLLATGTVAGALDESFSNNGQLEIWAPNFLDKHEYDLGGEGQSGPQASITTSSRFNRLAWGYADGSRERGVLVAGMENGDLDIWDPSQIILNADPAESLILQNKTHTGPIRGLDFNPIQTNLFASGAVNGEIYIWDLKDPSMPYSPGTRSTKLDEITALAWNHHVQYALAASSSSGYTVVWDLRGKREVAALAYGGGAGTLAGGVQGFGSQSLAIGGRRGMSDVAWHPDNPTRLVTSSEDDTSPIIMVWDLRNARAPEKILTGHEKGVLSLSWCKQDADLLLSCGKDNRALCWNPQTSEIIGELPSADNWAFQVDWCPRNPDLFATAFFDGTIGIHSIQSTNESNELPPDTAQSDGLDIFNAPGFSRANQATLSLTQPPKWLRRPTSVSFGYGGKLVSVSNLPGAHGKNQSSVVHIRKVTTEQTIVDRAKKLQEAVDQDTLSALAEERSVGEEGDAIAPAESASSWKALLSLFKANSRDELITLLGFSKSEIASRVAEAVENLKAAAAATNEDTDSPTEQDLSEGDIKPHEPVVSFAEPERDPTPEYEQDDTIDASAIAAETTPSEVSGSATSDTTSAARLADGESTTTVPSLFGDDNIVNGTPQIDAAADFFGSIGTARTEEDDQMLVPHHNYPLDSSVAATIGSRPSSIASESLKNNTFRIYPNDESETDRLVTKALVLGDFESAVSLCLSSDRFADAILLAVRGGPELLQKTQKAYFERRTTALPYLRLFQSIVSNDLEDVVQNADLQEWQEIFVVLCTFARQDEFSSLAEQLGQRLEFQASLAKTASIGSVEDASRAREFRRNATLTYLAAGKLERLVNIWIDELAEEERVLLVDAEHLRGSRYTAHALALQTFIEKVTVFRKAINYSDSDLEEKSRSTSQEAEVRVYKLSGLYDRYFEYADLLVAQGLVKEAVEFLKLTPKEYHGSPSSHLDFKEGRERLLLAAGVLAPTPAVPARTASLAAPSNRIQPTASTSSAYGYGQYGAPPVQQHQPPIAVGRAPSTIQATYETYGSRPQPTNTYGPPQIAASTSQQQGYGQSPYGAINPYAAQPPASLAPPVGLPHAQQTIPPPPPKGPPVKRENGGWNDAPAVSQRRTPVSIAAPGKPTAITSPFPNQPSPSTPPISSHGFGRQSPATLPPPPRPRSVQQRGPGQPGLPPPPVSSPGVRIPGPPQVLSQGPPPHMRPPSGPPGPPPARMMSPPQGGPVGISRPPPSQYLPSHPQQSPRGGQTLPPHPPQGGPYLRATPSPGFSQGPPPPGPYAPPPAQHQPPQQAGFAAPQHIQQQGSFGPSHAPPPHAGGSFAPPPAGTFNPPPQPRQQQHQPGGSFAPPPPPSQLQGVPRPGQSGPPPPPPGGPGAQRGGTPAGSGPPPQAGVALPRKTGPPPPKYPPGDRSHIPANMTPVFNVISGELDRLRQTTPPQQKRLVDDLERRVSTLFDALNCETLSDYVCEQLIVLAQAMAAHDRDAAMAIHVELLTRGSLTDDIGLWMSGLKQLVMRL